MNTKSHEDLVVAGGSVTGRIHRRAGRASQDALAWVRSPRALVGVVSDGCGSGAHSDVGAKLGARLYAAGLAAGLDAGLALADPALWRAARAGVLAHIRGLAAAMAGASGDARDADADAVIAEYFLFTIVGIAATAERTAVFAIGDGAFAIFSRDATRGGVNRGGLDPARGDGNVPWIDGVRAIGPFPDNQPPYLAYDLLGIPTVAPGEEVLAELATADVDTLLVATDGVSDMADSELAALAADDAAVRNPDGLRRRLALLARDEVTPDWSARRLHRSGGRLSDDTTVLVVRSAR